MLLATNLRDSEGELDSLLAAKGDHHIAACIPARDEASTIGTIAAARRHHRRGGQVTELLTRPLLRRFFPALADVTQPLAGECAVRRAALEGVDLADGYGIEIGLLVDVYRRYGRDATVEVGLGERVHRNRPLHDLRPHADDVLGAVADRIDPLAWNRSDS